MKFSSFRSTAFCALAAISLSLGCVASPDEIEDFHHSDDTDMGDSVLVDEAMSAPGVRVPASLGLSRDHVIYLTFDDGPSPQYTRSIMATLAAHHAPATFFVTGASIAANEATIRAEDEAGFHVANHQWSHVIASSTQFAAWVPRERDALDRVIGHRIPRFFRYPYGSGSTSKETVLRSFGYTDGGIGWNIDTLDWCYGSGNGTCARASSAYRSNFVGWVVSEARRTGGGVVLFHDIQRVTNTNLDAILTQLEAAGFTFGDLPTEGR